MSRPEPDGKHVMDASRTQLGKDLAAFVERTLKEFNHIVGDSELISKSTNSLTGYMFNNTMVFMQLIELLIAAHKTTMMLSYQETIKRTGHSND